MLCCVALHGRLDACKVLLQWGRYKVDETDCCGTTPLMDAFRSGHTDVADLLLWQQKVMCIYGYGFYTYICCL